MIETRCPHCSRIILVQATLGNRGVSSRIELTLHKAPPRPPLWARFKAWLATWCCMVAILSTAGCSSPQQDGGTVAAFKAPLVTRPVVREVSFSVPGTTNTAALVTTNTAPDGAAVIVTNQVVTITAPRIVTSSVTNYVTEVNPALASALQTARDVNSAVNPTPAAPIINAVLLGLSGVLGWLARFKTVKAAQAQDAAAQSNGLVNTLIAGVEASKNDDVKKTIAEISAALGNRAELNARVQAITRPV